MDSQLSSGATCTCQIFGFTGPGYIAKIVELGSSRILALVNHRTLSLNYCDDFVCLI